MYPGSIHQVPHHRLHRRSVQSLSSYNDLGEHRRQHLQHSPHSSSLLRHSSLYTPHVSHNMPHSVDLETRSLRSAGTSASTTTRSSMMIDPGKPVKIKKKKSKSSAKKQLDDEENTPLGLSISPSSTSSIPAGGPRSAPAPPQYVLAYPNSHQQMTPVSHSPRAMYAPPFPHPGNYPPNHMYYMASGYPTPASAPHHPGPIGYMDPVYGYQHAGGPSNPYMLATNPSAPALMGSPAHSSASSETASVRGGSRSHRKTAAKKRSSSQNSRVSVSSQPTMRHSASMPGVASTKAPVKTSQPKLRSSDDMPLSLFVEKSYKQPSPQSRSLSGSLPPLSPKRDSSPSVNSLSRAVASLPEPRDTSKPSRLTESLKRWVSPSQGTGATGATFLSERFSVQNLDLPLHQDDSLSAALDLEFESLKTSILTTPISDLHSVKSVTDMPFSLYSKSTSDLADQPIGSSDVSLPDHIKKLSSKTSNSTSLTKRKSLVQFGFRSSSPSVEQAEVGSKLYTDLPAPSHPTDIKRKSSFFGTARRKSVDSGTLSRSNDDKSPLSSSIWKKLRGSVWNPAKSIPSPPPSTLESPSLGPIPDSSLDSRRSGTSTPLSVSDSLPVLNPSTPTPSGSSVSGSLSSGRSKSIWSFWKKMSSKPRNKETADKKPSNLKSDHDDDLEAVALEQQEFEMALKRPEARRAFFEKETQQLDVVSETTRKFFSDLCVADLDFDELLKRYDADGEHEPVVSSSRDVNDTTLLRNYRETRALLDVPLDR